MYDIILTHSLRYSMISYMISYCHYDIICDIIPFFQYHSHLPIPCAIFSWYCLRYHTHIIRNLLWYQNYMILSMILAMIWPTDISITWYHSHTISQILWCYSLYHGTCAAGWRGLGAPGARRSTSSCLAIANVLGSQWGQVFSFMQACLVVAGLQHEVQDWFTDSHAGLPGHPHGQGRLRFTASLAQHPLWLTDGSCHGENWQAYWSRAREVTARALIIEIQLHSVP